MKIVIFGGTTEGRRLSKLLAEAGASVTVCVATEYGEEEQGSVPGVMTRTGPLSAEEKQTLLCDAALCVDATHPYASHVTGSVKTACKEAGVEYIRLLRPACDTEDAVVFDSAKEAAEWLREREGRVLLTTGANIVLTVLWVKGHGMLGAALATCVCTFVGQDILLSIYYIKRIGIHVPTLLWRSYRGVLPALLLAGAGAYGITLLFENRLHALLLGGFGYVLLAAGLLLCFGLNASERDQIRAKLKKIGGKP